MKAGVLFARNDMRCTDWAEPELAAGCVKVRVRACGICGSDVPRVLGAEAHGYPIILGHEFSGEVAAVSPEVTSLSIGDRIAGAPLLPCMRCENCMRGQYALCLDYGFIGSRSHGAFAEYVVIPAANAVKIGRNVSFIEGALFEPASVALHGLFCADFHGGEDTVILGAGNIGILAAQWARIFGARRVAIADIQPGRLALGLELGADVAFNLNDEDVNEKIAEFTNGRGFPYVFETAGQPDAIKLGFELVANRGAMTCVGTPHSDFSFGFRQWEALNRKEFRLTGTWMSYSAPFPGREWSLTADYFDAGALKLHDVMIFRKMPLESIKEAFELFETPGGVKGKLIIEI